MMQGMRSLAGRVSLRGQGPFGPIATFVPIVDGVMCIPRSLLRLLCTAPADVEGQYGVEATPIQRNASDRRIERRMATWGKRGKWRLVAVLLLGTLVPTLGSATQVSWHAAARYSVSTANPDYRSRVEIGLRYRPMLTRQLGLDVGGLLQFENGLPVQERLRYEGDWVRHWGVGIRYSRTPNVTLLAALQRTTRGYAIADAADDQGYYVSPAVGAEVNLSLVGKPVTVSPSPPAGISYPVTYTGSALCPVAFAGIGVQVGGGKR